MGSGNQDIVTLAQQRMDRQQDLSTGRQLSRDELATYLANGTTGVPVKSNAQIRQDQGDIGREQGRSVFYDQTMNDAADRYKDYAKGYNGNELGALKSQANAESGAKRSQYLSQLSAKAARGGVGGARAAAMQGAADVGMQGQNNEMQRKMTLDNAEMIRKGNKEYTNYELKRKYGVEGMGIAYQKMALAEQTSRDAAAAGGGGGGGGTSFICSALRKYGFLSKRDSLKLTKFMLKSVLTRADFFAWYFTNGKKAIDICEDSGFNFGVLHKPFVLEILETLENTSLEAAQNEYISKAGVFCTEILGECGYKESMSKPGILKSIIKIPLVFVLPSTWVWIFNYTKYNARRSFLKSQRSDLWVLKLGRG